MEIIEFYEDGFRWKRYKSRGKIMSYFIGTVNDKTKSYHVYKYEKEFGMIDSSVYDIHHKDMNPFNNNLDNLIKITHSEHISIHHTGKTLSQKTRDKISKKVSSLPGNFTGHKHSDNTKAKMSLAKGKSVMCKETNKVYRTITIASKETGICNSSIARVCDGKNKHASGTHWEWV